MHFAGRQVAVEWAPWGGQSGEKELTVEPGFREKEADGQAPHVQD